MCVGINRGSEINEVDEADKLIFLWLSESSTAVGRGLAVRSTKLRYFTVQSYYALRPWIPLCYVEFSLL